MVSPQVEQVPPYLAVVEDDERCRVAMTRLLRAARFEVEAFASAEAFLASMKSYACLICDVQLPGLSGVQLADHLRGLKNTTPILFVTGGGPDLAARVTERTNRPCLFKPVDETQFLLAVSRILLAAG